MTPSPCPHTVLRLVDGAVTCYRCGSPVDGVPVVAEDAQGSGALAGLCYVLGAFTAIAAALWAVNR